MEFYDIGKVLNFVPGWGGDTLAMRGMERDAPPLPQGGTITTCTVHWHVPMTSEIISRMIYGMTVIPDDMSAYEPSSQCVGTLHCSNVLGSTERISSTSPQ